MSLLIPCQRSRATLPVDRAEPSAGNCRLLGSPGLTEACSLAGDRGGPDVRAAVQQARDGVHPAQGEQRRAARPHQGDGGGCLLRLRVHRPHQAAARHVPVRRANPNDHRPFSRPSSLDSPPAALSRTRLSRDRPPPDHRGTSVTKYDCSETVGTRLRQQHSTCNLALLPPVTQGCPNPDHSASEKLTGVGGCLMVAGTRRRWWTSSMCYR